MNKAERERSLYICNRRDPKIKLPAYWSSFIQWLDNRYHFHVSDDTYQEWIKFVESHYEQEGIESFNGYKDRRTYQIYVKFKTPEDKTMFLVKWG